MREITVSLVGPERVPARGDPDRRVWRARYVDRQGRRRATTIGDAREVSESKAQKIVRQMEREFAADSTKCERLKRVTVAELVERYVEAKSPTWAASTRQLALESATELRAVVSPSKLVRDFTLSNTAQVIRHLRSKPISKSTVRKHLGRMSAMFKWATQREQRFVHENPFDTELVRDARKVKTPAKHFEPYSGDEVEALRAVAPSDWWRAFIVTALGSGLRPAELSHLQWRDVDLTLGRGRIRVIAKDAGEFQVDDRTYPILPWETKSHHNRSVPVSDEVVEVLLRLRDSASADGSPCVFLKLARLATLGAKLEAGTLPDRYQAINNVLTRFQQFQRRAFATLGGRHRIGTVHDMRKTYGTNMAMAGVPIVVLCKWMGHSSVQITERFYVGVDDSWDARARLITSGKSDPFDPSSTPRASSAAPARAEVVDEHASRYREAG